MAEPINGLGGRVFSQVRNAHPVCAREMRLDVLPLTPGHKLSPMMRLVGPEGFHSHPLVLFLVGQDQTQSHHWLRFHQALDGPERVVGGVSDVEVGNGQEFRLSLRLAAQVSETTRPPFGSNGRETFSTTC